MKIVRIAPLFGLLLLLSACAVTVTPADFDVHGVVGTSDGAFVNDRLALRAYPSSTVIDQQERRGRSTTTFETRASLDDVFDHFDRQLTRQGWRRTDLEMRPNRAEAEYENRDADVELSLNRQGNSGRYRLDIEFDD